ncbi:unnamed protein product [Rhizophagus irregularis]|nr:unnamed protein product [Rhizophagus irregularis]
MAEFDFYTPTAEEQEMIDQYLARTDAKACIDRVENKFQNKQIHINQESAFLPVIMNDALREMLARPDYSECIASFVASINGHSSN